MNSEEIKQLRIKLNMSQQAFAVKLGVGITTVNRWEVGSNKPSGLAEEKLQKLLKKVNNMGMTEKLIKQNKDLLPSDNPFVCLADETFANRVKDAMRKDDNITFNDAIRYVKDKYYRDMVIEENKNGHI